MATHVTRWSPDTCGCIIDYESDDANPTGDPRPVAVVPCTHHAKLTADAKPAKLAALVYAAVLTENRTKNQGIGALVAAGVPAELIIWRHGPKRKQIELIVALQRLATLHVEVGRLVALGIPARFIAKIYELAELPALFMQHAAERQAGAATAGPSLTTLQAAADRAVGADRVVVREGD